MTEGLTTALIATAGGLVTMLATKLADVAVDRHTNWRQESKALRLKQEQDTTDLRARLEQCERQRVAEVEKYEENRLGQERRINDLLNKLGFFEYRLQAQEHQSVAQTAKMLEQTEDLRRQLEEITRLQVLLAAKRGRGD